VAESKKDEDHVLFSCMFGI